jgi:hypothetical protein
MPSLGRAESIRKLPISTKPTGSSRGDAMIGHVKAVIDASRAKKLTPRVCAALGNWIAVANKAGLFGFHQYTDSSLTNTVRNATGSSSGWRFKPPLL